MHTVHTYYRVINLWTSSIVHICMHTYMYAYIHGCIHTCMHTYMYAYIHVCMHTCNGCIHAFYEVINSLIFLIVYIHVCIHTCMYTYMYAYIHGCIHTFYEVINSLIFLIARSTSGSCVYLFMAAGSCITSWAILTTCMYVCMCMCMCTCSWIPGLA